MAAPPIGSFACITVILVAGSGNIRPPKLTGTPYMNPMTLGGIYATALDAIRSYRRIRSLTGLW